MHRQLREQFELKSSQLDEARKNLFFVQEEASALKIDLKELQMQEAPEVKQLSEEVETLLFKLDEQQSEIQKMEALIQTLSASVA